MTNRPLHVSRRSTAVVLATAWLALGAVAAVAQAQSRTHRQVRQPAPTKLAPRHLTPSSTRATTVGATRSTGVGATRTTGVGATRTTPAGGTGAAAAAASLAARSARSARRDRVVAHARLHRAVARAHMAGDPAVSMVDFSFSPGSTTIHVGDTVTWTNTGKQAHSATADNHSFDTGLLRTGQSGSHTFNTPGTFTYFCIVHPYMHGTIVVLAATTTTSTTPTSTTPTASTAAQTTPTTNTTPTTSGQTLPFTGTNDLAAFAIGLLLVGGGLGLRARSRASAED
jgi:plastocyanin